MADKTIKITCLGDIMPGGILHYSPETEDFCSADLLEVLHNSDFCVGTLETAVGDAPEFDEEKMKRGKDVIYCPTSDLWRLKKLGVKVVSLANNHAWDLGYSGIPHVFEELDKIGIKYCGAGRNLEEASKPAVLTVKGKTIAFIAYCDFQPTTCGYIPIATEETPGINAMIEKNIQDNILRLRDEYDYLFVMMHWGKEYYYYPMGSVKELAKKMIDWGADGIIGSHSHQIQPSVFYHKKPIIYNLGNFLFPDRIINSPRSTYYPKSIDNLNALPKTWRYPFVEQPTFKIWRMKARTGQVVTIIIKNGIFTIDRILTSIDQNSHLEILHQKGPLLFRVAHHLVKLPKYEWIFFGMRGCRFLKNTVVDKLQRLCH